MIEARVLKMAYLLLDGNKTVREVAKLTGYSKSTVHNDLTTKLIDYDYDLFIKVNAVLQYNKKIRHIRGGEATRTKYLQESQ